MSKLFIEDLSCKGKRVLMRVDFNVPLDDQGRVTDQTRIAASLPSIRYVLEKGGSLVLMSHLGRPKGKPSPEFSLAPVASLLSSLLKQPVAFASDCRGKAVLAQVKSLLPGELLLLENLRFHRAEEYPEEDPSFAEELASFGDLYVNDAFGSSHRKHSSLYTVPRFFEGRAAAGYLLEKEIHFLGHNLKDPRRPFYALIGGAKVSTKLGVITSLLDKVDALLIGGGMAYTLLKAQGMHIGQSLCEETLLPQAREILLLAEQKGVPLHLPADFVVAKECSPTASYHYVERAEGIAHDYQGLDIGPKTIASFSHTLKDAALILWNGPVGVFEIPLFAKGTYAIAEAIAASSALTIVAGGDSIAALNATGLASTISHISTGGGATLEYIEYGTLPGIEALSEKKSLQNLA